MKKLGFLKFGIKISYAQSYFIMKRERKKNYFLIFFDMKYLFLSEDEREIISPKKPDMNRINPNIIASKAK